jgi:hypothetical protein
MPLNTLVYINQGICGCDGSLAINSFDGTPPYSYSIDAGVSFRKTPIFTDLCIGTYTVIVKDSLSAVTTNTIVLNKPNEPITYSVFLNTTSSVLQNNGISITKKYETSFVVTPPLPIGTYITFDINHTNVSKVSPTYSASTTTTNSQLVIDSIVISPSLTGLTTGSTYNSTPGCQSNTLYVDTITDSWSSLTLSGTTNFLLTTTTSLVKNVDVDCYYSTNEDFYSLSNLNIFGCSCCRVSTT